MRARAGMGSGLTNRSTLQHIAGYRASICSATARPLAAVLELGLFFEQMQAAHSSESWKEAPSKASAVWGKVRYAPKFRFLVLELFSSHFTVLFSPFLAPLGFLSLSLLVTCLLDGSQASPVLTASCCRDFLSHLVTHLTKSPTERPSSICLHPSTLPWALFSKTKGRKIKTIKKVLSGVGWHFQKHF